MKTKEIIVGISGSIAAYKAVEVVSRLTKLKARVSVIMTASATRFITPLTLQTISKNRVMVDLFDRPEELSPVHITLTEKADLILICPATANIIAKLAAGIADDLLTCTVLASQCKVLICPAMNERMYKNKISQSNIQKLKRMGYLFIGPGQGDLASGSRGKGRLAEIKTILNEVNKALR